MLNQLHFGACQSRPAIVLSLFALALPGALACQELVSLTAPVAASAPDQCDRVVPPAKPSANPAAVERVPSFPPLALRGIYIGGRYPTAELRPIEGFPVRKEGEPAMKLTGPSYFAGYDLDGVCTCDGRPGAANGGKSACASKKEVCDLEGGVDNQFAKVIAANKEFDLDGVLDTSKEPLRGGATAIISILGYNGLADDPDVNVALVYSVGHRGSSAGDVIPPGSPVIPNRAPVDAYCNKNYPENPLRNADWRGLTGDRNLLQPAPVPRTPLRPKWDGCDTWMIASPVGEVVSSDKIIGRMLPTRSIPGYVRDGVLYAFSDGTPSGRLSLFVQSFPLEFSAGIIRAEIKLFDVENNPVGFGDTRAYRLGLRGTISGRLRVDNLLRSFGLIYDPDNRKSRICGDLASRAALDLVRAQLCDNRDVSEVRNAETATKGCNAISATVGFDAYSAYIENYLPRVNDPDPTCFRPPEPIEESAADAGVPLDAGNKAADAATEDASPNGTNDGGTIDAGATDAGPKRLTPAELAAAKAADDLFFQCP
jgi:hypothetical protein